jgi:RNA polymerase sigma-70 factor (ECF subfamily)
METTSLSLLERACQNSDAEAWRVLADIYTPWLRRWCRKSGLQESDVDDVVQDVLVVVARELPNFRHNRRVGAFRTWLRGILIHRLQDLRRRAQHRPAAMGGTECLEWLQEFADPQGELSRLWDQQHDQHVLRQLLTRVESRFSASTVQAFRRIVLDQVDADDAAREIGLSLNAVVVAKCKVLKELRREARGLLED